MHTATLVGFASAIFFGAAIGLAVGLWLGFAKGAAAGGAAAIAAGAARGLRYGGGAWLRQSTLIGMLRRLRLIPADLLGFLDDMDSRALLRRAGGGYLFIHGLLRDYLAPAQASVEPSALIAASRADARAIRIELPRRRAPSAIRNVGAWTAWSEQALAEIATRQFVMGRLSAGDPPISRAVAERIAALLEVARDAALDRGLGFRSRFASAVRGTGPERVWGHMDAADEAILAAAPDAYVVAQLPRLLRRVQRSLAAR
jgi:hypothetical protein